MGQTVDVRLLLTANRTTPESDLSKIWLTDEFQAIFSRYVEYVVEFFPRDIPSLARYLQFNNWIDNETDRFGTETVLFSANCDTFISLRTLFKHKLFNSFTNCVDNFQILN